VIQLTGNTQCHGLVVTSNGAVSTIIINRDLSKDIILQDCNTEITISHNQYPYRSLLLTMTFDNNINTHDISDNIKMTITELADQYDTNVDDKPMSSRFAIVPITDQKNTNIVGLDLVTNIHNTIHILAYNYDTNQNLIFKMNPNNNGNRGNTPWEWIIIASDLNNESKGYATIQIDNFGNTYLVRATVTGQWVIESWNNNANKLWKRKIDGLTISYGYKLLILIDGSFIFVGSVATYRSDSGSVNSDKTDGTITMSTNKSNEVIVLGNSNFKMDLFIGKFHGRYPQMIGIAEKDGKPGDSIPITWNGETVAFHSLIPGQDYYLNNSGRMTTIRTSRYFGTAVSPTKFIIK
jgi:hypothetical protein